MSSTFAIASIFREFMATGQLGPIKCGMTKADVERCLGKANPIENYPGDKSLWCYWPAEIRFYGEHVDEFGIGFEWWDGKLPGWLRSEGVFPVKGTSMASIRSFLEESGIAFEVGKDGRMLRTAAGVWIFPTTEDTMMTAAKECGGPCSFFDERFRVALPATAN